MMDRNDGPLLWLRIDPELSWIRKVAAPCIEVSRRKTPPCCFRAVIERSGRARVQSHRTPPHPPTPSY